MTNRNLIFSLMLTSLLAFNVYGSTTGSITKESVQKHVSNWPDESKKAADFMIKKYGLPSGVTPDMVVWNDVKPFKRTIIYKEAVTHKFPMEHRDVLEHFIDYKAPSSDKVAQIWDFDGSVMLERTKGEMSARCDNEEANFLALNLANQIVEGKTTVEDARTEYAKQIMAMKSGKPKELTQKLVFTPAKGGAGDPGEPIMDQVKKDQTKQAEEAEE